MYVFVCCGDAGKLQDDGPTLGFSFWSRRTVDVIKAVQVCVTIASLEPSLVLRMWGQMFAYVGLVAKIEVLDGDGKSR